MGGLRSRRLIDGLFRNGWVGIAEFIVSLPLGLAIAAGMLSGIVIAAALPVYMILILVGILPHP